MLHCKSVISKPSSVLGRLYSRLSLKADCLGALNQSKPPQEHADRAKGSSVHWGTRRRPHMGVRTSVQLNFCPKASLEWDTQSHQNRPDRPTDLNSEEFYSRAERMSSWPCMCLSVCVSTVQCKSPSQLNRDLTGAKRPDWLTHSESDVTEYD